jgi:DNA-directed RNA polymerase subunit L
MANLDTSIYNSYRRTMISKLTTYAFEDIQIIVNTSCFNNDMIIKRIEMIPLEFSEDLDSLEFYLSVQADDEVIDVLSKDLEAKNGKTYFPKDIVLAMLKDKQKLELKATAVKGNASINSKFNPICTPRYQFLTDSKKMTSLDKSDPKYITNVERAIINDKNNFKTVRFGIESIGMLDVMDIFPLSTDYLIEKCETIKNAIEANNIEKIQVIQFLPIPNTNDYIINSEDHTLGCLIENYGFRNKNCEYAGYKKAHPLEDTISIRLTSKSGSPNKLFIDILNEIIDIYKTLKKEYAKLK